MPFILRGTFCSTHLFFRFVSDLDSFCISRCGPVAQRLPVFSLSSLSQPFFFSLLLAPIYGCLLDGKQVSSIASHHHTLMLLSCLLLPYPI